jgi:hypothetical protein
MLRVAGIVALLVLAACDQTTSVARPTPSEVPTPATWTQDLTFAGEVSGHMTGIVPNNGAFTSACTGAKPRPGETWSDQFYGTVDASGTTWGVDFVINNYGGPGTYMNAAVRVQVHSIDNGQVWQNAPTDVTTFMLDRGQQSGSIDALLTNADSGKAGALHLTGHWNCKA